MVAWQPVGAAMGVYDVCARYIQERQQFGSQLAAFQLVQERMARMLGTVQVMRDVVQQDMKMGCLLARGRVPIEVWACVWPGSDG